MIWDALTDAKQHKSDLVTVWLDIANAYGTISHRLILLALERYGVSKKWISIIETYYASIWSKSCSEGAKSNWHRHERGIFAGCCVSIILFLAGMNVIIEYICNGEFQAFMSSSKQLMPLTRAFMDDLNLLAVNTIDMDSLLKRASTAVTWARMGFRAKKSRSLVIVDGKVSSSVSLE